MVPADHHSDSEGSDADSVEEVHITRYLNKGLLAGLQQAKACTEIKSGINRQTGYYHLRDRTHAVLTTKVTVYDGKHWDVPIDNRLQRATRRLTAYAIQKAVAREQLLRVKSEADDKQKTFCLYHPINTEYWDRMQKGQEEEREKMAKKHNEVATVKDEALCELVRRHNKGVIEEDVEEERERQVAMVSLLNALKDSFHKTPSLENLMVDIAETCHRKSIFQQDLTEAYARFADEEQDVDQEYRSAMMEMMDVTLCCLQQLFQKDRSRRMAEAERRRLLQEQHDLIKEPKYQLSRRQFDDVMRDLLNTFHMVEAKEIDENSKLEQELSDRKELVLQELRRGYAQRYVDRMVAIERKRRTEEEEKVLFVRDPQRESLLKLIARVQRQMILQKFAGKWINLTGATKKDNKTSEDGGVENEHDKKLRAMRLNARRQSCVISGRD